MASSTTLERALESEVTHLIALRCFTIAGLTVFLYDALLTSSDEIKYVWGTFFHQKRSSRRRLISKILYLCTRVAALIVGVLYLYAIFPPDSMTIKKYSSYYAACRTSAHGQPSRCENLIIAVFSVDFFVETVGNGVILYRLLLLWEFHHTIKCRLAVVFLLAKIVVLSFAFATLIIIHNQIVFVRVGSIQTCAALSAPLVEAGTWIAALVVDTGSLAVFFLNALSRPRTTRQRLMSILYRDGIIFFLPAICMRIVNLVLVTFQSPLLFYLTVIFSSLIITVGTCRSYLNLFVLDEERRSQKNSHLGDDDALDDERFLRLPLAPIPEPGKCG